MRSPKYQLRMNQGLFDRLTLAGSTRVREALEQAFPVVPDTDTVVPQMDTVAAAVVPERSRRVSGSTPVVPEGVSGSTADAVAGRPVVPAWKAKLDQDRERLAGVKAAKDRARAEAAANSFHGN